MAMQLQLPARGTSHYLLLVTLVWPPGPEHGLNLVVSLTQNTSMVSGFHSWAFGLSHPHTVP